MKFRYLGNSCIEILEPNHIIIDPNFIMEPFFDETCEYILVTHEHDDHFDLGCFEKLQGKLVAPISVLEKFNLNGETAVPGEVIGNIHIFENNCYKSIESVGYYISNLIIHNGDAAGFPDIYNMPVVFTACFPDFYKEYLAEFERIKPKLVIPIHYNQGKKDNAINLVNLLNKNTINSRVVEIGQEITINYLNI